MAESSHKGVLLRSKPQPPARRSFDPHHQRCLLERTNFDRIKTFLSQHSLCSDALQACIYLDARHLGRECARRLAGLLEGKSVAEMRGLLHKPLDSEIPQEMTDEVVCQLNFLNLIASTNTLGEQDLQLRPLNEAYCEQSKSM